MCKLENITCKSENIDDRQNGARKYLLQTIYYYYFQYEIENRKNIEILYKNIQRKGMLINRLSQINNEWIEFIVGQFSEFLTNKKLNWILDDLSEYKKKEKLEENDKNELLKIFKQKMNKNIT